MRTRTLIAICVTGALALAGCGDDGDDNGGGGGSSSGGSNAGAVKLSETDFKITPANPSVDKPGKVTFTVSNDGQTVHALEVEGPGEEKETDSIDPGQSTTLEVDLDKPGTYEFYCPIGNHRQMGMAGEITVAGGGSSSSGGTKSTEEESSGGGSSGY
jgi:plastocyanin